jgi:hypothetical protein
MEYKCEHDQEEYACPECGGCIECVIEAKRMGCDCCNVYIMLMDTKDENWRKNED